MIKDQNKKYQDQNKDDRIEHQVGRMRMVQSESELPRFGKWGESCALQLIRKGAKDGSWKIIRMVLMILMVMVMMIMAMMMILMAMMMMAMAMVKVVQCN